MKTPQYYTFNLAANGLVRIRAYGQFVSLLACAGKTSVLIGFDEDPPQLMYPGKAIDCGLVHYESILVSNPGAGIAGVELTVGDSRIIDNANTSVLLTLISTTLTTISAALARSSLSLQVPPLTLAITPGPGTPILAAATTRKEVFVEASLLNTGTVYLGKAAANCKDSDCFAMLAPGQAFYAQFFTGGIWGVGSDATQQVTAFGVGA